VNDHIPTWTPAVQKYVFMDVLMVAAVAIVSMLVCAIRQGHPDWLDAEAKALVLLVASVFFLYTFIGGHQRVDLELSLRCERTSVNETTDLVIVFANLGRANSCPAWLSAVVN
jgi:hypothetical protein